MQPQQSCARVSNWPISIHTWVYVFSGLEFSRYVLINVLYSRECLTKSLSMTQNVCFFKANIVSRRNSSQVWKKFHITLSNIHNIFLGKYQDVFEESSYVQLSNFLSSGYLYSRHCMSTPVLSVLTDYNKTKCYFQHTVN